MPIVDFNLGEWGRTQFEVDKNRFDAIGGAEALVAKARGFIGSKVENREAEGVPDLISDLLSRFALAENLRQDYTEYVAWYTSIKPGNVPLKITDFNQHVKNRWKLLQRAQAQIGMVLKIARNGRTKTPITIEDIRKDGYIKPSGRNKTYVVPTEYFSGMNFNRFGTREESQLS